MVSITYLYLDVSIADTQLTLGIIFFSQNVVHPSFFTYLIMYYLGLLVMWRKSSWFGWCDKKRGLPASSNARKFEYPLVRKAAAETINLWQFEINSKNQKKLQVCETSSL